MTFRAERTEKPEGQKQRAVCLARLLQSWELVTLACFPGKAEFKVWK